MTGDPDHPAPEPAADPASPPSPSPAVIPSAEAVSAPAQPVLQADRIRCLDVLRGFALMGVLLMNMQAFAMPFCAYMNPSSYGNNDGINYFLWCLNHIWADAKFITIFSMMFGAGVVLMTQRSEARTGRSAKVHYRRMFWMMVFGAIHGLLIWYGDILFTYSVCGLIVYLFRRRSPWLLITIGILLLHLPVLLFANMDKMPEADRAQMMDMWAPSPETMADIEAAHRGGYPDHLAFRTKAWVGMMGFLLIFGWRILGVMLVGMALFKNGVLTGARSKGFYCALVFIGFGVGVPLSWLGIQHNEAANWDMIQSMGIGSLYNYYGSLLSAMGWIGVIMLTCRAACCPRVENSLGAVGQMAFTNYIMHSVICTTIFYGHGLGQFGRIDRVGQLGIVLAIAAFQMWVSPWWLKRYKFGPLEWLWRTCTYWRSQPMRRASAA